MEALSTQTTEQTTSFRYGPRWYHAATLEERLASAFQREQDNYLRDRIISEQALKKLLRWREQAPFNKGSFFADRLAMDNISEQDLLALLDEPVETLQERIAQVPDWLTELAHHLTTDTSPDAIAHVFKQAEGNTPDAYALLRPFYPLLQSSIEHFQATITALSQQYTSLPFNPDTLLSLLLPNLARQMMPKLNRAVVLEMNIARLRGQLQGDTSQERFHYYLQFLGQRANLQAFLEEYCILARQLMITSELWVNCNLEFARHLCSDWTQIRETFTPEQDPGTLINVAGGAGDTHRNGHSVMILHFQTGWRLVYKPRSLSIDTHFQELLTWLNARGNHPAFRTLNLIDKATYGWVEFVPDAECSSEDEIRRFYERQGGYLALLYALDALDFHAENVIAAGEHPLLIDLEALFHPRLGIEDTTTEVERPAQDAFAHSVMRIALLPQRVWSNDEFEGVDISGLGETEGQLSPHAIPQWESIGTDEMKLIRERVKMNSNKNSPKLRGQSVRAGAFIESITAGFSAMYQLLIEYRDELVAEILPRFAHDEVRFIARATRTYALLLSESFHPNNLRNALKRERFFDRLWAGVEYQPSLRKLIPAERADLFRGDIPLFTTYPNSRDLFTSQGECIPAFFSEPAIEQVRKRLYQFGKEDLQRQMWMIRAAFTSAAREDFPVSSTALPSHTSIVPFKQERFIAEASIIGDRLCEIALHDDTGADWLGLTFVKEREWSIAPAGIDLYSGLPGIILFLSYLGTTTGEPRYTIYAMAAFKTLRAMIGQNITALEQLNIGAFNGIGSYIYLLSHLAALWNDPTLVREGEEFVQLLPKWITKDDQFDIVDGAAGCIVSLLSLYSVSQSPSILSIAIQCGDRLLTCAQPMIKGISWRTSRQEKPPLGFAHGNAGIAWSLVKLAAVSGEERFRHAASEALLYERSMIAKEQPKQPEEVTERSDIAWSHGTAGIALARLASLRYMDDEITRQEIETALTTLLEEGIGYHHEHIGPNHSLAHGDFGTLEALLVATQTLTTPHLYAARERIAAQLLESIKQHGWIMGVPLNVETPGLMFGLAGIGYELLRLSEPDKIPSVLILASPAASGLSIAPA